MIVHSKVLDLLSEVDKPIVNRDKAIEKLFSDQEGGPKYNYMPVPRVGYRPNDDGTKSSHLMAREYVPGRGWVVFPTLYQNADNDWIDLGEIHGVNWWPIYEYADKIGEIYDFGEDEDEAIKFADKGSWKELLRLNKNPNFKTQLEPLEELRFQKFFKTLPENLQTDDELYDIRGYWDAEHRPDKSNEDQPKVNGEYHAYSRHPITGKILKSPAHPTFDKAMENESHKRVDVFGNIYTGIPKLEHGGSNPPASHYKRLYSHDDKYIPNGLIDPNTGYKYFPEESPVPEDLWNTSRFLYQPFIAGEKQGVHNATYDESGEYKGVKELPTGFKAAKEDISNYYEKDLGQTKGEARSSIMSKMQDIRKMHRAQNKMGDYYFTEFQNPDHIFDETLGTGYQMDPNNEYYKEPLTKGEAKRAYTKFQKAWRGTSGKEARENSRNELEEARIRNEIYKKEQEEYDTGKNITNEFNTFQHGGGLPKAQMAGTSNRYLNPNYTAVASTTGVENPYVSFPDIELPVSTMSRKPITLFVGDSQSGNKWEEWESFAHQLVNSGLLGEGSVNKAIGGNRIDQFVPQLKEGFAGLKEGEKFDIINIMGGGNNSYYQGGYDDASKHLQQLYKMAYEHNPNVKIVGISNPHKDWSDKSQEVKDRNRRISTLPFNDYEYGPTITINASDPEVYGKDMYMDDLVHLNEKGNQYLYDEWVKAVLGDKKRRLGGALPKAQTGTGNIINNGFIDIEKTFGVNPLSEEGLEIAKKLHTQYPNAKFVCTSEGCAQIASDAAEGSGQNFSRGNAWDIGNRNRVESINPAYEEEVGSGVLSDPNFSRKFPDDMFVPGNIVGLNRRNNSISGRATTKDEANDSFDYANQDLYPRSRGYEHVGFVIDENTLLHGTGPGKGHPAFFVLDNINDNSIILEGYGGYEPVESISPAGFNESLMNFHRSVYDRLGFKKSGGDISQMGYRDDSPYRHREYIDIETEDGVLDMSRTGKTLLAQDLETGEERVLPPYSGLHKFLGKRIREWDIT